MGYSDDHKYDDIINIPHHVSSKRQRMPMIDRAAQFSPFVALTGYNAAVKETARLTDKRIELDENEKAILDEKLRITLKFSEIEIIIAYFKSDAKKDGRAYISSTSKIKKINNYERMVVLTDGVKISIEDIVEIKGELSNSFDGLTS